jgi:hypothetical protein
VLKAVAPGSTPSLVFVTWGALTGTCQGVPCLVLDGGAGTIVSDPIAMTGFLTAAEASVSFFCKVPSGGAQEDYFAAQYSNDGNIWAPATQSNTAAATQVSLIDGGVGDGGLPGWILLGPTPAAYVDIALTHLAPMTAALACNAVVVSH